MNSEGRCFLSFDLELTTSSVRVCLGGRDEDMNYALVSLLGLTP